MRLILLLLTLIFVSCTPKGTIEMTSLDRLTPTSITNTAIDVEVDVVLRNTFKHKITATEAEFEILSMDHVIAKVNLLSPIVMEPLSDLEYKIPIRMRLSKSTATRLVELALRPTTLTVRGSVTGRLGAFTKKIKFNRVLTAQELSRIIKSLEIFK